ncbi:MAG: hypothetical protein ACRDXB_23365 [Actinomycetes bacterium]
MPCTDCGESFEHAAGVVHRCDPERLAEFQTFKMRDDIAKFEARLRHYLLTTTGRFEVWLAARQVRKSVRE